MSGVRLIYDGREYEDTSPTRAIRAKCLDCCAGQKGEIRQCTTPSCPLWPFRMGRNPFIAVKRGEEVWDVTTEQKGSDGLKEKTASENHRSPLLEEEPMAFD